MKIGLVIPGGVDRSGERRVIPALLALLRRLTSRHDVHVFALTQEADPATWTLEGAKIHNIGTHWTRRRAVLAILREHRRGPFALIHAIWSGPCGLVAVCAAGVLRVPSIVHVAGGELTALAGIGYGGRLRRRGRIREALILRSANVVSAASTPMLEAIGSLGLSARRIPLGVDLTRWSPRQPSPRAQGTTARLVHIASLNRVKDQTTLLRAVALLAADGVDFHLDVAGEDTLGGEIQALSHTLGLDARVQFHGFLTQSQLYTLVTGAHVHLVSSLHEAGPLALLEAAVLGVPTVGTRVGHVSEWAPGAAIAVARADPAALARALRELLANEEQRLRIARAAQARALSEDADYTAREIEKLYAELI